MSKKIFRYISSGIVLLIAGFSASAQSGEYSAYSPYTIFGIGDIVKQGTPYQQSMGGVGIATRNKRFINTLNPASLSAGDTLSFMADVSVVSKTVMFEQGNLSSGHNLFNLNGFTVAFPIYKKSAMQLGIAPYSNVGYDFTEKTIDPVAGIYSYTSSGDGGIYQIHAAYGARVREGLSLGAQVIYYFGNINKTTTLLFSSADKRNIYSGNQIQMNGVAGKFGIQYEKSLGNDLTLTSGLTYKTSARMKGTSEQYTYASISNVVDTLSNEKNQFKASSGAKIPSEFGIGFNLRKGDKWNAELNYIRSDWGSTKICTDEFSNSYSSAFSSTVSQSLRAGFEFVPNRNDVRYYFRRCAYRVGAYYDTDYFKYSGNNVNSYGLTLGITLPVFRWYNGLSLGVDLGQRGKLSGSMVRERYIGFNIGFNIHDIWFQKPRYE